MSRGKRYEEPKLNFKKVFAVAILLIVIIMCIIMVKGILSKDNNDKTVTSIDYFAAYQNQKWGVIDSNRKCCYRSSICRDDYNTKQQKRCVFVHI